MALSLYAATIPSFQQILTALAGTLDKAEAYCAEQGIAPEDMMAARLAEDMLPFTFQVKSTAVHSLGAIEGVRKGVFSPDRSEPPADFAGLRRKIADTLTALEAIEPREIESFIGQDMRFEFGDYRMDFTAEDFLLSFSVPNFYFHAATAYDILRWQGVQIGKRDFMGRPRLKA